MNRTAISATSMIDGILDLERYPIHDLSSRRGREFVAASRAQLQSGAAACFSGFVRQEALSNGAREVVSLVPRGFRHCCEHNVYFVDDDPSYSPEHPRRLLQRSQKHNIAGDLIGQRALIRRIYEYEPMSAFLAAVVGANKLYPQADPLSCLNVMVYGEGDRFGWHFDRTPCSVTIMLQEPEAGGVFQYVPFLRARREEAYGEGVNEQEVGDSEDEGWERLSRILGGSDPGVVDMDLRAGTMSILYGRHSLHRVTPVEGERPRVISILAYEPQPGVIFNDETRIRFYGRAR